MPAYAYLLNIKREPLEVLGGSETFYFDGDSIDDVIRQLTQFKEELPDSYIRGYFSVDDDSMGIEYTWFRYETEQEMNARIDREEHYNRVVRERRSKGEQVHSTRDLP
jgi:hypothetical protein